jgi:hypothetical protein
MGVELLLGWSSIIPLEARTFRSFFLAFSFVHIWHMQVFCIGALGDTETRAANDDESWE